MTATPIEIFRLRIAMADLVPPIWRLVEVPSDFTLDWLHDVIQWSMGWEHQHPYRFYREGIAYVEKPEMRNRDLAHELDAVRHSLHKVFGERGRYLRYVYDMGDTWRHHVWLEDVFKAAPETAYPRLVAGERASPPEGFGGIDDYRAVLRGESGAGDAAGLPADFDPEDAGEIPRDFPNARTYVPAQTPAPPKRPHELRREVVDMLGSLAGEAGELLAAVDGEFRADLCRAIEDVALADDALPPNSADVLREAHSRQIGVEPFLLNCVRRHEDLSERFCTAPFHAAHLLAFWRVESAVDVFLNVARHASLAEEGLIDTVLQALVWSGDAGVEALLDALDGFGPTRRRRALEQLTLEGVRDDRLFERLRDEMQHAGPADSMVPLLLSRYDDERASKLLLDALDYEIAFLTENTAADDAIRAQRADYALFLTEMLADTGATLDDDRWQTLDEIEDFYWPSPAFKKRLRK